MGPRSRVIVVLLALAVCLGGVGVAVGQSSNGQGEERVVNVTNTTNQLSPASAATDGYSFTGLDVGTAVAADATRLAGLHKRLTLETALEADDGAVRRIAARDAIMTLKQRATALGQQRRALLSAHADGDLSTQGLVSELVHLDAIADHFRAQYNQLDELSGEQALTGLNIEAKIKPVETTPQQFEQPALDRIAAAMTGAAAPQTVYLQGGPSSLLVGTVGESYIRQALVSSDRNGSRTNQFINDEDKTGWTNVLSRTIQLYPWATGPEVEFGGAICMATARVVYTGSQ